MIKKKAIIDLNCPIGHINFIKFYIDNLKNDSTEIFLNKRFSKFYKYKNAIYFDNKNYFSSLAYSFKIAFILKNLNVKKCIFVSYDHRTFFITSYLLKIFNIKNIVIEHDNIKKKISNFFYQKIISSNTVRLTYTKNIKKYAENILKVKKIYQINFPIIKDYQKYNVYYDKTKKLKLKKKLFNILVPTRFHLDFEYAKQIIENNPNAIFYTFSKKILFKNSRYIENLNSVDFKKFDLIFLPFKTKEYDLRVSSWIYKSLAYNKPIILNKGFTYKVEKKRFPNFIFSKKKLNKKDYSNKKIYNYKNYNLNCIKVLKNFLN